MTGIGGTGVGGLGAKMRDCSATGGCGLGGGVLAVVVGGTAGCFGVHCQLRSLAPGGRHSAGLQNSGLRFLPGGGWVHNWCELDDVQTLPLHCSSTERALE